MQSLERVDFRRSGRLEKGDRGLTRTAPGRQTANIVLNEKGRGFEIDDPSQVRFGLPLTRRLWSRPFCRPGRSSHHAGKVSRIFESQNVSIIRWPGKAEFADQGMRDPWETPGLLPRPQGDRRCAATAFHRRLPKMGRVRNAPGPGRPRRPGPRPAKQPVASEKRRNTSCDELVP